ncbi:hypothetical protein BS47DRAFT_1322867 [Hydnum rufescens UP504]|uniref:NACHT domain-containing protein n=1 Tax=Hydnum rufescens UP504 TaxID=1448309 RepID=A0A9P6ACK0_9AGAM|nr:hypothetical protein BS47DRAFT_1322867 [Hydnum rufescens UP504]
MDQNNIPSGLEDDVRKLSKDLEHIASSVQSKSSAGRVRRFLERNKDEHDLPTFSQNVKAALDRFQLSQTLRQEQELFLEKRSVAVMSLPRANSAAYDSGREDAPSSCLEGTRVSILTEIMSWFESMESGTPPIYWLVGLAGIGKSTIAKTAAERANKNRMLGGSFFFSRSDAPLRNPNLVFPTLAFQLAQSDNEFKNVIGEVIQQDATLGHKNTFSQFEGLILKPLGRLGSSRQTTLIVLDALDECEEQGADTIVQLLLSHASRLPFLRVLITSRPEPHISSVFTQARNLAKRVLHDIEASVIEEDLRLYIRSELRRIRKKLELDSVLEWTDRDIDSLVEKSGKLFIYAATSIRFIGDDRVRDPRGHLGLILDSQLSKELEVTPYSQLDSLYVGVLRNSLSDSNRKAIVKRFQTVVGSIVLLRQPLPLGSLVEFVQCTPDDVHTALRHLRSVIIPPSTPDEAPRIYHPSFRDFIMDPSRCAIPDFVIVAGSDQELRHALRCLKLMEISLRQDVAGISDVSLLNSEVKGLEEKVRDALSAEVQYACRYWASHLSCVELGEKRMVEALEGFSRRLILMWIEAMSLIGSLTSAVALIEEAHRWATKSQCEATVIALLADARRFLLIHRELIRGSALQVYHSALAFTPYDTALYKTYSKDVKSCIRVLQGVEAQWPQSLSTLSGHSHGVYSVAFSPNGLQLASGSEEGTLYLWDAMSGEHTATLQGHSDCITSLAFSPNGLWLASGSWDETLCLWDVMLGTCTVTLQGHSDSVSSVAFSPDGLRLASGSDDHTLCLWDAMLGCTLQLFKAILIQFPQWHFHLMVCSLCQAHMIIPYACGMQCQAPTLKLFAIILVRFPQLHFHLVGYTLHQAHMIIPYACGMLYWVCTLQLFKAILVWFAHLHFHPMVCGLHQGQVIAPYACGIPCQAHTLQLSMATPIQSLQSHFHLTVYGLHLALVIRLYACGIPCQAHPLSPLMAILIESAQLHFHLMVYCLHQVQMIMPYACGMSCLVHTLQLLKAILIGLSQLHSHLMVYSLHLAHLIKLYAYGMSCMPHALPPFRAILIGLVLGVHIATSGHSKDQVGSVAFSPNGLLLASGSWDSSVYLLDAMSGAHIATLHGHSKGVTLVAFSPDGSWLASGSYDHTVCLWDAMSRVCIATLEVDSRNVLDLVFSFDGHTLISQTPTNTFAWDLTSQPPQLVSSSILEVFPPTISLTSLMWSRVGGWIQALDSQGHPVARICYIPPHYCPETALLASSLLSQPRVAVGCRDGHVIIVDPQDHPFVQRLEHGATPS